MMTNTDSRQWLTRPIRTPDGIELFCQHSLPLNTAQVDYHFVVLHGAFEHHGRHDYLYDFWYQQKSSFAWTWFDLRGFGESGGIRSHVDYFSQYSEDLLLILNNELIKLPTQGKELFLVAHSMGGLILLKTLQDFLPRIKRKVNGVILSNPALRVASPAAHFSYPVIRPLRNIFPYLKLPVAFPLSHLGRNEESLRQYKLDPSIPSYITTSLLVEMLEAGREVSNHSCSFSIPTLFLLAGEDRVVSTKEVAHYVKNSMNQKTTKLIWYEHLYHEIFREPERDQVFHDMKEWIEHLPQGDRL